MENSALMKLDFFTRQIPLWAYFQQIIMAWLLWIKKTVPSMDIFYGFWMIFAIFNRK